MSDQPPRESTAVYAFFEMFALAFAFSAVENWFSGKSGWSVAICALLSVVLFLLGVRWSRIKELVGEPRLLDVIARYRILIVIAGVAYLWLTPHAVRIRYAALTFVGLYIVIAVVSFVRRLRSDLDKYVMPRQLSSWQLRKLRASLASRAGHAIKVKVDPFDLEAINYAGSILNALVAAGWNATLDTTQPYNHNQGLGFLELGSNSPDASLKGNTKHTLERAFADARIVVNHGGSVGAGEYELFITVGARPLAIVQNHSILAKFGMALQRLGRNY